MSPNPQSRRLSAPNAWREVLRPDFPQVDDAPQLEDSAKGRRINKSYAVAVRAAEVPALVEQRAPQPSLASVSMGIEQCQSCSPEEASVRRVARLWHHKLNVAPCRPS